MNGISGFFKKIKIKILNIHDLRPNELGFHNFSMKENFELKILIFNRFLGTSHLKLENSVEAVSSHLLGLKFSFHES